MVKVLNLKSMKLLKYQNIKRFLQNVISIWSEEVCVVKNVKNTGSWTYVISDLKCEEIVETFCEKRIAKKQIKKSLELKCNKEKR